MLIMHGTVIAVVLYMACNARAQLSRGRGGGPQPDDLIVGLVLLVGGCVVVGWLAGRGFPAGKARGKGAGAGRPSSYMRSCGNEGSGEFGRITSALLRITARHFLMRQGIAMGWKIAICDDDAGQATRLQADVTDWAHGACAVDLLPERGGVPFSPERLRLGISCCWILKCPAQGGIDLAKRLRSAGCRAEIIFIVAF